jgi:hypothetical protein
VERSYLRAFQLTLRSCKTNPPPPPSSMPQVGERMYHEPHFTCENCSCVLDTDADVYERSGAPYCADCNLKLYASCPGCGFSVVENDSSGAPPSLVSAMERNWHVGCLKCASCSCLFADGVYFAHDDGSGAGLQAYCEEHHYALFAPKCRACVEPVRDNGIAACGASWHTACFSCTVCKVPFSAGGYFEVRIEENAFLNAPRVM